MKIDSVLKIAAVVTFSSFITACASTPKPAVQVPSPSLGAAALAAPEPAPAQIVETARGPSLVLDNVLFNFEESSLRSEAGSTVEKAASYLRDNPERSALIEGHTDHTGDPSYNKNLSVERSESLKDALMSLGISESRIQTKGLGEANPVANNSTFEGRQANRRVEVIFVE